ncbi:MAG TPA: hypothetical protein VJO52_06090 [Gemmatimonadaceae bacterium]|nr:hypothetical protein [Gemmatimonadaceae bacterium]
MLHLDPERLAALAEEQPTHDETAHLATCPACAREQAAYEELVAMAARERNHVLTRPLTDWRSLSARLADEPVRIAPARVRGGGLPRAWMQIAAGLVIAAGGMAVGRASAARTIDGSSATSPNVAESMDSSHVPLASVGDAMALMRRAESDYRLAAAFVVAHDTSFRGEAGVDRYRQRLAALDRVSDAALAAANQAPADPVINQYLISARTARQVTLQQLNSSLPAGMSLTSY